MKTMTNPKAMLILAALSTAAFGAGCAMDAGDDPSSAANAPEEDGRLALRLDLGKRRTVLEEDVDRTDVVTSAGDILSMRSLLGRGASSAGPLTIELMGAPTGATVRKEKPPVPPLVCYIEVHYLEKDGTKKEFTVPYPCP